MKSYLFFIVIILTLFSCQTDKDNKGINELKSIVLIDTFNNELILDTAHHITVSNFIPFYIGQQKDTILMKYFYEDENAFLEDDFLTRNPPPVIGEYGRPREDEKNIALFVDTNQFIGSDDMLGFYGNNSKEVSRGKNKSYPLFIKNVSDDTLNIGYGDYLPALLEAKDSLGNWKTIQKPYIYFCGTGMNYIFLEPKGVILVNVPLFAGTYQTQMRVAYGFDYNGRIFSNEFEGMMNYSQFEKKE